jgi:hypothetical protein
MALWKGYENAARAAFACVAKQEGNAK